MTEPKTAADLEALVRRAAARDETRELEILIEPLPGETPNWNCKIKYADADHGWGPKPAFIHELADLKRRFHLQE